MSLLGFTRKFTSPYFTGGGTTADVPGRFDVGVSGYGYMLDRNVMSETPLISSIRATRTQADQSQEPGEQSLNPDDLWRRSQQSWHLGAGQDYLDRDDSDRRRFRTSKGIDPWTEGELSLLNATTESLNAAGTNLRLMPAGSRLYAVDGTALKFTTDLTSWTTVTGTSGVAITGIASDGTSVWVTDGANVYVTNTGVSTASSWSTIDADLLAYVKGRLMIADGPEISYFSDLGTPAETSLFTHANSAFSWVGFAEGPGFIYAAGYAGDKSLVYKITLTAEGTALAAPTVAGELPDGEIIAGIGSYLGNIFLGTSEGARFCSVDTNGFLRIGELIPTDYPVRCFEGQGPHVWYGLTNYDGTSGGLGRLSLRTFSDIDALKPAYASDLMVTSTANILDVCTFTDKRVFAVSGDGFYTQTADLVASGTIDLGRLNFNISEKKIPLRLDVTFASGFAGTATSYYAVNGSSTFTLAGTQTATSSDPVTVTFPLTETLVDQVEIRHVLARASSPTTSGPVLLRTTVRSLPVPSLRRRIVLPLVIHDRVDTNGQTWTTYDCSAELGRIETWRTTKEVLTLQIGNESYAVVMDDFDFIALQPTEVMRSFWQGTVIAQFKTV